MIAQCKALRGYFYSWLYQCYRQVPLVTSSLDLNNMYQPKAERSAILQQILTDYNEAIADLPDKLYTEPEVSGRFTKAAVQALKARLLLFDAYVRGVQKKKTWRKYKLYWKVFAVVIVWRQEPGIILSQQSRRLLLKLCFRYVICALI